MSNILPIPSTVYNWKNILVVDGVTYTLQKTTLQDKDFVISCWDEASPNNYLNKLTDSQYFEKYIINKSLFLTNPLAANIETMACSVFRRNETRIGHIQSRWIVTDGELQVDRIFNHIHKDYRGKGYQKYLMSLGQYGAFARQGLKSTVKSKVLDSSIPAKKFNNDIDVTYVETIHNTVFGNLHVFESDETVMTKYVTDKGLTFSTETEQVDISDSKWATEAVNIARNDSSTAWNREFL